MNQEWRNKSKKYKFKDNDSQGKNKEKSNMIVDSIVPTSILGGLMYTFGEYVTIGSVGTVSSIISGVGTSIGSILSLPIITVMGVGAGSCYGIYKILTKDNKYKKEEYLRNLLVWNGFFEEIQLMNCEKDLPIFVYDIISENKRSIKFEVPRYITKSDFISKQQLIEEFLGVEVGTCKMTFKDNFAYIKVVYHNELNKKFYLLFKNINIKNSMGESPDFICSKEIPHGIRAYYTLPDGISPEFNKDKCDRIKATFLCESIKIFKEDDKLILDVITEALPSCIPYKKPTVQDRIAKDKTKLEIVFGEDLDGKVSTTFDEANGHMIISGESGSGKSCATRVGLVSLVQNYTKEYVRLWVGDFKQVELFSFAHTRITERFATETDDICRMILDLEKEMKRRYTLFKDYRVNDIRTYNMKVKKKDRMHRTILFIEEIAMLFQLNNKYKVEYEGKEKSIKDILEVLVLLGQQSRACGLHIWATIQRPSKDSFDPRLKANLSTRFCLSCADEVNSRIILGEEDSSASQLRGNGHAIIKNGDGKKELQTYYIPFEDLDNLLYDYLTDEGKRLVDEDRKRMKIKTY